MECELLPFLENKTYKELSVGVYTVYQFEIANNIVYAVKQFYVGEIVASATVQMLITHFNIDLLINFGIVGALTEEFAVCETVLVGGVVHHQFDLTVDGMKLGHYSIFEDVLIKTDERLLSEAIKLLPNLPVVNIASGDKFVADREEKQKLARNFNCQICDMESAGILITARLNNLPVLFIKTVSDGLLDGIGDFYENVEKATRQYVGFVDRFLENLTR